MFTTKKQVDQHVKTSLAKLRNENEKKLRGFIIAKMYFKIGEYTSAQHYVSGYLAANEAAPQAHRLLGDCYVHLKQVERALNSYQRSLQLDPKQTDLIIEACSLLLNADMESLKSRAKFWYDVATSQRIEHESVFNLKLKILSNDKNKDSKQAEDLIKREIGNRPKEAGPRIQLIKFLIEKNRIVDAFQYIHETQTKSCNLFIDCLDWYNIVAKVLQLYRCNTDENILAKNWDFWLMTLICVERQLSLNLIEDKALSNQQSNNLIECQNLLFELDQLLNVISGSSFLVRPELTVQMLLHYKGQFCLHVASYLIKREKSLNNNQWWTTSNSTLPMLLFAFHIGIADVEEPWLRHTSETVKELVRFWQKQAAFRCSQSGRTLLSCVKDDDNSALFASEDDLISSVRKRCASNGWRKNLFKFLFSQGDHVSKINSSFLVNSNSLEEPIYDLPTNLRLEMYEKIVDQSESLGQLVYLHIKNEKLGDSIFNTVDGLEITTNNLNNCNANTLNKLDMETFFLATLMQTRSFLNEDRTNAVDARRPLILPYANMIKNLCTLEQARWWECAYKAARNFNVEEKEVIADGISVVRLGNSKMDLMITLLVGEILQRKAESSLASEFNRKAYEKRAISLYQSAVHEIKNQNFTGLVEKKKLFKFHSKMNFVNSSEYNRLTEKALIFLAEYYFKTGEFDQCISQFSDVHHPTASYYLTEAQKKMEDLNKSDTILRNVTQNRGDLSANLSYEFDHMPSMMNRSRREENAPKGDTNVMDQVLNLTCLVQQLSLQNTMLQTELMDIKKMLQQKKEVPPPQEPLYRMEEQQRMAMSQDYFNNRYPNFPINLPINPYQTLPFQIPPQFNPHIRPTTPLYGQENIPNIPINQSTPLSRGLYDPVAQLQNPQLFYSPATIPQQIPPQIPIQSTPLNPNVIEQAIANTSFLKNNWNSTYSNNEPVEKAAPVNVVITSSDPLPAHTTITSAQPLLSVTIPPQHIKNFNQEASNFPTTIMSSVTAESSYQNDQVNTNSGDETATEDESETYEQVTPDIQEPQVEKAPQNEIIYFSGHCKLYRFADKTWKEKGVGELKIFKNKDDNNIRLTMHRDQTQTLCANHNITGDMKLDVMQKQTTSFVWAAVDCSGGEIVSEKFCVKFKAIEQANGFKEAFERSIKETVDLTASTNKTPLNQLSKSEKIIFNSTPTDNPVVPPVKEPPKMSFTFGGTPQNKDKPAEPAKPNPFANFTFGGTMFGTPATTSKTEEAPKPFSTIFSNLPKPTSETSPFASNVKAPEQTPNKSIELNKSGEGEQEDDYVPTAQFKPVIPLPGLIDVKTGEEDEIIAFEHRAKLLRFDPTTKEWKERGLGNIKILVKRDDPNKARLLMRREQVLKLACNQLLLKDQVFKKMPNSETALTWYAQDYAENELKTEMFAIRFKTSDTCKAFHEAILKIQKEMGDSKTPINGKPSIEKTEEKKGFGDTFKPKVGSWECNMCLVNNKPDTNYCAACDNPKDDTVPKKENKLPGLDFKSAAPAKFSFGMPAATTQVFQAPPSVGDKGFGDAFKPKEGSWNCKACYISNKPDQLHCVACESPKDDTVPKKEAKSVLATNTTATFNFGIPAATPQVFQVAPTVEGGKGFGDAFKPKEGSWNCKACYISNKPEELHCVACETPKDDTVPKKEAKSILATNTTATFSFGIPTTSASAPFSFGTSTASPSQFSFGGFGSQPVATEVSTEVTPVKSEFSFGSAVTPSKPATETPVKDIFALESKSTFNFVFKPKSPGKVKSPLKVNGVEEDNSEDEENVEEENNTYFTPVIPLPDKIEAKTGEEDETVLYSHRAKLYRFTDGEWKERGLGDIKVLKHNKTEKLRVVMRREQVLKICLNHVLDADVEYKVKDNKSWHFVVNDFSEGTLELSQFCIRFKTQEISDEFKAAIDSAIKNLNDTQDLNEFVTELELSDEEKNLIKDLWLPKDFFAYKTCEGCAGCIGCNSDEFVFKKAEDHKPEVELPLELPPLKVSPKKKEVSSSVFGSITPQFGATSSIFSGFKGTETNSVFGGAANFSFTKTFGSGNENSTSIFGQTSPAKPETSIFGEMNKSLGATNTSSNSLFGSSGFGNSGGNIFGGTATTDKAPVFGSTIFGGNSSSLSNSSSGTFSFMSAVKELEKDKKPEENKENVKSEPEKKNELTFQSLSGMTFNGTSLEKKPEAGKDIFKIEPGLSFASLATQSGETPAFTKKGDGPGGFFGLSNTNDFKHFDTAYKNANGSGQNGDQTGDSVTEDANYDPHYEPIIALPDEVATTTGEEEEQKLFGERGCLYRYDADLKEWKERGVGEFKILHHPEKGTYRFVMRREQIFKLVLNQSVTADLKCNPMNKTGKSYCWAAMNHAEPPAQLENLAIKFKNTDIATQFETTVRNCIDHLKQKELKPEQD